jgi:tetratricopeptide (TPR) repeat protein
MFDEALRMDPSNFRAAYNLGVIQHRLGNTAAEIEVYRRALVLKPDHTLSLYNLAAALSAKGEKDAAIAAWEAYQEAGRADPAERVFLDAARKEITRLKGL